MHSPCCRDKRLVLLCLLPKTRSSSSKKTYSWSEAFGSLEKVDNAQVPTKDKIVLNAVPQFMLTCIRQTKCSKQCNGFFIL